MFVDLGSTKTHETQSSLFVRRGSTPRFLPGTKSDLGTHGWSNLPSTPVIYQRGVPNEVCANSFQPHCNLCITIYLLGRICTLAELVRDRSRSHLRLVHQSQIQHRFELRFNACQVDRLSKWSRCRQLDDEFGSRKTTTAADRSRHEMVVRRLDGGGREGALAAHNHGPSVATSHRDDARANYCAIWALAVSHIGACQGVRITKVGFWLIDIVFIKRQKVEWHHQTPCTTSLLCTRVLCAGRKRRTFGVHCRGHRCRGSEPPVTTVSKGA